MEVVILIGDENSAHAIRPIEFIVRYESINKSHEDKGEYGIPLSLERAIPYEPFRHIPVIGMVSYRPKDTDEMEMLNAVIEKAYAEGIIKSYEKVERNIELKDNSLIPDDSEDSEH
jgi:hypothetical protein